jgi:ABC-2 type transport system permease protein
MNSLQAFHTFFRIKLAVLRHRILGLREESSLMVFVIVSFVGGYWGAGYFCFHEAMRFLYNFPGLGTILLDRMFYLFFAFLLMMLFVSNMIIGYSNLFRNAETRWLLTLPVSHADVYRWKFIESICVASWAFLFLSGPLMVAYGTHHHVGWTFYLKVLALFIPFLIIPAALGSLGLMLVSRIFQRKLFKRAIAVIAVACIAYALYTIRPSDAARLETSQMVPVLNQLLANTRVMLSPLLPSYWLSTSILALGAGMSWKAGFFFLVLLANALMALLVSFTVTCAFFYRGYAQLSGQGGGILRAAAGEGFHARLGMVERGISVLSCLSYPVRALIVKDWKVFIRDTAQWSQFVIFFGLLGMYILNLRSFSYDWQNPFTGGLIAFLNLTACSMTMATLTTRFVFPQFSLEGKRLWIVGMAPLGLRQVLLEKFWVSAVSSMLITLSLMWLTCWMLTLSIGLTVLFTVTVVMMSLALSGLAVGLGALYPNFKDDNPSKVVSGFGGTFCLLLSIGYISIVIVAEALPIHLHYVIRSLPLDFFLALFALAWALIVLLSIAAAVIPMRLAMKRVELLDV